MVNVLLMILSKYLFYIWLRRKNQLYDENLETPGDYTVIVSNIDEKLT